MPPLKNWIMGFDKVDKVFFLSKWKVEVKVDKGGGVDKMDLKKSLIGIL